MLSVSIVLRWDLAGCHGDLVHLRRHWVRVGQGWASVALVRRVWEVPKRRSSLIVAVELMSHVGSASGLVRSRTVVGPWGIGHLTLVARLRITTSTTTLMGIAAASRAVCDMITHITMSRLGRFASEMAGLRSGCKGSLVAHLSLWEKMVSYAIVQQKHICVLRNFLPLSPKRDDNRVVL